MFTPYCHFCFVWYGAELLFFISQKCLLTQSSVGAGDYTEVLNTGLQSWKISNLSLTINPPFPEFLWTIPPQSICFPCSKATLYSSTHHFAGSSLSLILSFHLSPSNSQFTKILHCTSWNHVGLTRSCPQIQASFLPQCPQTSSSLKETQEPTRLGSSLKLETLPGT